VCFGIELPEAVQGPKRVNGSDSPVVGYDELLQGGDGLDLLGIHQQALSRKARELDIALQRAHEGGRGCTLERSGFFSVGGLGLVGDDPINAAAFVVAQVVFVGSAYAGFGGVPAIRSPADTEKFAREQYETYEKLGVALGLRK
jgi:hypothetical protein